MRRGRIAVRAALAVVTAFAGALLTACPPSVTVTTVKSAPPRDWGCHLDVYLEASKITRGYEELCLIDSNAGANEAHEIEATLRDAKHDACGCGADAVYVRPASGPERLGRRGNPLITGIRYTGAPAGK